MKPTTAVILAGGANRRYPTIKAFIKIGPTTIIERNLSLLGCLFNTVFINTNTPEVYARLGAPMIGDVLPSRGPMTGIHAALLNAGGDSVFVAACDMPFLNADVVSLIVERYRECSSAGPCDAVVPVFNGAPQPLCGVYAKSMLVLLEEGVMNDKASLKPLLSEVRTHFINEDVVRSIDPEGRSFANINTPEDYGRLIASSS
ncbi:MAG: molybdenum cofactor guanylyltransferase [Nitrospirota bacterium]